VILLAGGNKSTQSKDIKTALELARKILEVEMGKIKLHKWDSAEHLKTDEEMVLYLEACLEEAGDDAAFIAKALGTIARAKGMTQLAKETGLGRESLYKALSGEGNPSFATILKVTTALGIKLHAQPA
jgi:probable addiction module antidote protein